MDSRMLLCGMLAGSLAFSGCASKTHRHSDLETRVSNLEGASGRRDTGTSTSTTSSVSYTSRRTAVPAGYVGAYMALPTGYEATSTLLVEKFVPASITAGSPYDYKIVVTNLTSELYLSDVRVNETLADGLSILKSTPQASISGRTATWNLGNLAPEATVTIDVQASTTNVGEVQTCATATYTPLLCLSTVAERPAIETSISVTPSATNVCETVEYTTIVTNTGTGIARNVQVNQPLPSGLTTVDGASTISFTVESLAAGESKEVRTTAKPSAPGTYSAKATATADGGLRAESGTATTTICEPVVGVDVTGPDFVYAGGTVTYNATVRNTGNCADTFTLTAAIPECTSFVSATEGGAGGSTITWNLGTIEAGATRNVSYTVKADDICSGKTTTVRVVGECAKEATDTAPLNIAGIPAILLEAIDLTDPIRVGDEETYEIIVTNQGSAQGTGIQIVVELEKMSFLDGTGPTEDTSVVGNKITFAPLPSLEAKAQAKWIVKTKALEKGDVRFKITLTSDQFTRPIEETESTNIYE